MDIRPPAKKIAAKPLPIPEVLPVQIDAPSHKTAWVIGIATAFIFTLAALLIIFLRNHAVATPSSDIDTSTGSTLISQWQARLSQFEGIAPGSGVVLINLENGETSTSNPNKRFLAASLYKLYVAEAVYREIDAGKLKLTAPAGKTGMTVSACLKAMINISNNPCGVALGTMVGWNAQNPYLQEQGYMNTYLRAVGIQETSAADTALLLQRLYSGKLLGETSTRDFINNLKNQQIDNRLPQGLPKGTEIAHKTGDLDGVVHDAGIVYTPEGDYLIVVMTGPWKNPDLMPAKFASLSSDVYEIYTSQP